VDRSSSLRLTSDPRNNTNHHEITEWKWRWTLANLQIIRKASLGFSEEF
jgi:hypothetical protein